MRNIFRRQTETVAPTLHERAADLRASLRPSPTASVAMPDPGSDEDADAELIQLGHLFEGARVREITACEACNAAGREADRLMPPRPACLIYRASDNSLRVHQEMMMAEALAGREVRIQDIEWLRRRMPMHHEVLRPIREGERAHMDHPGRRFDIVPHLEAEARAEEIVMAWDAWEAERHRIYEKHVTEALENAADEAGRTAVALVEQIAGHPAHTAAGFRVKLRALTHYRREILLAEIPAEPDPDQILTHSLWRDMRNEGSQVRTGEPQPTELPLSALVPMVDFTGASMRELLAIRDAADMLCNVASAAMSQYRNRLSDHPSGAVRLNRSGQLMRWLSDALCHVITATEKEARGRSPEDSDDQQLRLSMLAVSTIDNDDPAETAVFARELLAMVRR